MLAEKKTWGCSGVVFIHAHDSEFKGGRVPALSAVRRCRTYRVEGPGRMYAGSTRASAKHAGRRYARGSDDIVLFFVVSETILPSEARSRVHTVTARTSRAHGTTA